MDSPEALRATFNAEAELYHSARPTYPPELFDELIEVCHLSKNARLLEIGPGTGQATVPLARRQFSITAVELGNELADVARRELRSYSNVEVITGSFEDTEFPPESFDLVYAATAFHWIKAEAQFTKPYRLLKSSGHLAIIHTHNVSEGDRDRFYYASIPIYEKFKYGSGRGNNDRKLRLDSLLDLKPEEIDEQLFNPSFFKVFPVSISYSAVQYVNLIRTYSPTLSMPVESQKAFLEEIHALIEQRFEGLITKHFAMTLTVSQKK